MFDDKARVGSRNSLNGYGGGLAGRGGDLNRAIVALGPLLRDLEPVAANLAARETRLGRLFRALGRAAVGGRAGGRDAGRAVREPRHHVHRARRRSRGPTCRSRSPRARRARSWPSAGSRSRASSCPTTRPSSASCGRASRRCRTRRRSWPTRFEAGTRTLPEDASRSTRSWPTCSRAWPTSPRTRWCAGRRAADRPVVVAAPDARVPGAGPDHLQLRHAVLPQRREPALRRRLERHLAALHHRPEPEHAAGAIGPNNEIGPRRAPANGPLERQPPPHQPLPEHRLARARRASARPATSATATRPARR